MPPPLLAAPAPAPALTQRARRILAAINKIKEELMLMGFISLMLLACEDQITYFCVPDAVARWITCDSSAEDASCSATDTTNAKQHVGQCPFVGRNFTPETLPTFLGGTMPPVGRLRLADDP